MALVQAGSDMGNWDVMNPPVEPDGQAYTQKDFKTGRIWVNCPYCGSRNFFVNENTRIENMPWKCKGSKCKREFEVNYGCGG